MICSLSTRDTFITTTLYPVLKRSSDNDTYFGKLIFYPYQNFITFISTKKKNRLRRDISAESIYI